MKRSFIISTMQFIVLSLSVLLQPFELSAGPQESYLVNRIGNNDKRYPSFLLVLELLEKQPAKNMIETGTARCGNSNFGGDGGSTIIFGDWASQNDARLTTVDISQEAIERARSATNEYHSNINFVCGDSIAFLNEYDQPIDFLYLDSFDFDYNNPLPSQEHHLKEIEAAYSKLHTKSIVMIDDCDLPHGGKGQLVINYLLKRGWRISYEGYQTILVR